MGCGAPSFTNTAFISISAVTVNLPSAEMSCVPAVKLFNFQPVAGVATAVSSVPSGTAFSLLSSIPVIFSSPSPSCLSVTAYVLGCGAPSFSNTAFTSTLAVTVNLPSDEMSCVPAVRLFNFQPFAGVATAVSSVPSGTAFSLASSMPVTFSSPSPSFVSVTAYVGIASNSALYVLFSVTLASVRLASFLPSSHFTKR